jgi:hypothetical protein
MPYIKEDRRRELTPGTAPQNGGELNYLISMLVLEADDTRALKKEILALARLYLQAKGMNYQHCNDIMGALTGARLEMSRRLDSKKFDGLFHDTLFEFYYEIVAPYEDVKIKENGDLPYQG